MYTVNQTKMNDTSQKNSSKLGKPKGVVIDLDIARSHISLVTRRKLLELNWKVLPHPSYGPDIAPSDYQKFRLLQNSLAGKNLYYRRQCKNVLGRIFLLKKTRRFMRGNYLRNGKWLSSKIANILQIKAFRFLKKNCSTMKKPKELPG